MNRGRAKPVCGVAAHLPINVTSSHKSIQLLPQAVRFALQPFPLRCQGVQACLQHLRSDRMEQR